MKTCKRCKSRNDDWIPFCTSCGQSFESSSQDSPSALDEFWQYMGAVEQQSSSDPTAGDTIICRTTDDEPARSTHPQKTIPEESGGNCPAGGEHQCDESGWCEKCGLRVVDEARKHIEVAASLCFAAVSDVGKLKETNQDHCLVRVVDPLGSPVYIGVVCDGVSRSNPVADKAAEKACASIAETIEKVVHSGRTMKPMKLIPAAVGIAHRVVVRFGKEAGCSRNDGPETTIVLIIVYQGVAYIGWVGDSRAYWLTDYGSGLLTRDHNFLNDAVDSGEMTVEQARADKRAAMITQALGSLDSEPKVSLQRFPLPGDGRRVTFLLCSDGLYHIVPEPDALAELVRTIPDSTNALGICRFLVDHAVNNPTADGLPPGHDNTTGLCLTFN